MLCFVGGRTVQKHPGMYQEGCIIDAKQVEGSY
jgi:hypothetical protein